MIFSLFFCLFFLAGTYMMISWLGRYVAATGAVGFLYTLVQIPFAIHHACTQKRLLRNNFLPEFDFYGDKVL